MGIIWTKNGPVYELETLLSKAARPKDASGLFPLQGLARDTLLGGPTQDKGRGNAAPSTDSGSAGTGQVPRLLDTQHTYDAMGRLTRVSRGARSVRYAYNDQGFVESVDDALGRTTRYLYDSKGRLAAIVRPDGGMVAFSYDAQGRLAALSTPMGASHGLDLDAGDLDTGYDAPLSGSFRQVYDEKGRVVKAEFPSGKTISYFYDDGRLTRVLLPEGVVKLSYGPDGLTRVAMGGESVNYEYEEGLLVTERRYGTLDRELSYGYEKGRLASFSYSGATRRYSYDEKGRLIRAGNFSIGRDPESGLALSVGDKNALVSRRLNENGQPEAQEWTVSGQPAASWSVARDAAGRIVRKSETANGRGVEFAFAYDAAGRLSQVKRDGALVEEYLYNADGARVFEVNRLRTIAGRVYDYDGEGRLVSAGETRFAYDRDGFLTRRTGKAGVTGYVYASRGGLLKVDLPDGTVVEYVNDPFGRRIAKKLNGKAVERYLWQGMARLLAVNDGWNNLLCRFAYADERTPAAMEWGGRTFYLSYDQVGSLRQVTDSQGKAVKVVEYDAFGSVLRDSAPGFFLPIGFAGGLLDSHTGLVRFGYRDYDPNIGRWTAKDPLGFAGGQVDLFGYAQNNPINFVDVLGLWGVNYGGSLMGIDFSSTAYDSNKGWFPSTTTDFGVSTTAFGGGLQITFDTPIESISNPRDDVNVSLGMGKYLGATYNTELSRGSVNLGIGLGLPITFSTNLQHFVQSLGNSLQKVFN